jgi:hypothetical protein
MLTPEHCWPTAALAAPGRTRAATVAAETTHADAMRRVDRDFIALLPPGQQVVADRGSWAHLVDHDRKPLCFRIATLLGGGVDKVAER